jgi:hypothetical protein
MQKLPQRNDDTYIDFSRYKEYGSRPRVSAAQARG